MSNVDYTKLLAISVLAALVLALAVPSNGVVGGVTVLEKSDRLPMAASNVEPISDLAR